MKEGKFAMCELTLTQHQKVDFRERRMEVRKSTRKLLQVASKNL